MILYPLPVPSNKAHLGRLHLELAEVKVQMVERDFTLYP
jgi:hypothetical protein